MKQSLFFLFFIGIFTLNLRALEIPSIFGDNMVLQQEMEVPIWGKAKPFEIVEVISSWGEKAIGEADSTGKWMIKLRTPKRGGPYEVKIKGENREIVFQNVLIGEVWVCSGQSNMEMPLMGWPPRDTIKNSEEEIKNANYPEIRLFTVSKGISLKPRENCKGFWEECSPERAKNFSAVAYFFGRELHKELGAPIGLIHTSWGGTQAEAWTPFSYIKKVEGFSDFIENFDKLSSLEEEYVKWLNSHPVITPEKEEEKAGKNVSFDDKNCHLPEFKDSYWRRMSLPTQWENSELGVFDGVVWFRKKVKLPTEWMNKDLILELGPIDDIDITYFNGEKVGGYEGMGFWTVERKYKIPKEIVKRGENLIAVRVIDLQGGGGLYGKESQMKIYPIDEEENFIKLSGEWKYLPVAEYREGNFYVFGVKKNDFYKNRPKFKGITQNTPTVLFNAMVNPLIPYGIKGVIWYQGESNVGRERQYKELFPALIEGWRESWGEGAFPFYFVQIAPYLYEGENSTTSAKLREAQLVSMLTVPNTGMVVTLDIGDLNNIHPSNKVDVGKRLALWALNKSYGRENVVCSGPIFKSMVKKGSKIILYFDYIGSGLVSKEEKLKGFKIAGEDRVFVDAEAYIKDNTVIVYSKEVYEPVAVRYAFTDGSEASLFNKEGLPASPFRTDDWED
ncbi:MAG: sialate O-acetylesterase [candidate division WOR-3 bacterium]